MVRALSAAMRGEKAEVTSPPSEFFPQTRPLFYSSMLAVQRNVSKARWIGPLMPGAGVMNLAPPHKGA